MMESVMTLLAGNPIALLAIFIAAIIMYLLVIVSGKKYNLTEDLKPIKDILIDVIKSVEFDAPKDATGEQKFNVAVAVAESRLTLKQKNIVEKSVFRSVPKLLQHVFNAIELLLVLKKGK